MASIKTAIQVNMKWRTNPPNRRNVARMSQVLGIHIVPTSMQLLLALQGRRIVCALRRVNLDRYRQLSKSGVAERIGAPWFSPTLRWALAALQV